MARFLNMPNEECEIGSPCWDCGHLLLGYGVQHSGLTFCSCFPVAPRLPAGECHDYEPRQEDEENDTQADSRCSCSA